jgi:hypothetical protein
VFLGSAQGASGAKLTSVSPTSGCPAVEVAFTGTGFSTTPKVVWADPSAQSNTFTSVETPAKFSSSTKATALVPLFVQITGTGVGTVSLDHSNTVAFTYSSLLTCLKGATGPAGPTGKEGPAGKEGATGATGAKGGNGATGATGAKGENGQNGPTGATGATGEKGEGGAKGVTGATGAQGATGPTGADGVTGATGATGQHGIPGVVPPGGAFYILQPGFLVSYGNQPFGGFCGNGNQCTANFLPDGQVFRTFDGNQSFDGQVRCAEARGTALTTQILEATLAAVAVEYKDCHVETVAEPNPMPVEQVGTTEYHYQANGELEIATALQFKVKAGAGPEAGCMLEFGAGYLGSLIPLSQSRPYVNVNYQPNIYAINASNKVEKLKSKWTGATCKLPTATVFTDGEAELRDEFTSTAIIEWLAG